MTRPLAVFTVLAVSQVMATNLSIYSQPKTALKQFTPGATQQKKITNGLHSPIQSNSAISNHAPPPVLHKSPTAQKPQLQQFKPAQAQTKTHTMSNFHLSPTPKLVPAQGTQNAQKTLQMPQHSLKSAHNSSLSAPKVAKTHTLLSPTPATASSLKNISLEAAPLKANSLKASSIHAPKQATQQLKQPT